MEQATNTTIIGPHGVQIIIPHVFEDYESLASYVEEDLVPGLLKMWATVTELESYLTTEETKDDTN